MRDRERVGCRMFGSVAAVAFALAAFTGVAWAQAAASPTTPAEIQSGHPPPATTGSTGTPQMLTPAPLPPGTGADTPGGAARNGVISPPAPSGDAAINRGAPAGNDRTPVVPPPGSAGSNPVVVPK